MCFWFVWWTSRGLSGTTWPQWNSRFTSPSTFQTWSFLPNDLRRAESNQLFQHVFSDDYRAVEDAFSSKEKDKRDEERVWEHTQSLCQGVLENGQAFTSRKEEVSRARWSGCSAVTEAFWKAVLRVRARRCRGRASSDVGARQAHLFRGCPKPHGALHVQMLVCISNGGSLHLNMFIPGSKTSHASGIIRLTCT